MDYMISDPYTEVGGWLFVIAFTFVAGITRYCSLFLAGQELPSILDYLFFKKSDRDSEAKRSRSPIFFFGSHMIVPWVIGYGSVWTVRLGRDFIGEMDLNLLFLMICGMCILIGMISTFVEVGCKAVFGSVNGAVQNSYQIKRLKELRAPAEVIEAIRTGDREEVRFALRDVRKHPKFEEIVSVCIGVG